MGTCSSAALKSVPSSARAACKPNDGSAFTALRMIRLAAAGVNQWPIRVIRVQSAYLGRDVRLDARVSELHAS